MAGIARATSIPGGMMGLAIKFITTTFFLYKLIEMTKFTKPMMQ